jgi:hypothetical protein
MEAGMQLGDRFFKSSAWGVIALCKACAREMEREIDARLRSGEWVEISLEEAQRALEREFGVEAVLAHCDECKDLLSHIIPVREP